MVLSDGDHIRNLLGAYCDLVDAGDHAAVGDLFGDDGVLAADDGTVIARGRDAIADFYARTTKLHDGFPRTKHVVANTVLEPGDDGAVTARSSFLVLQASDGLPLQPIITGRYVDRFERDGSDQWRWAERRFTADLVGHLGHHLEQL